MHSILLMLERRRSPSSDRRLPSLLLAVAVHGGALGLLLLPAYFMTAETPKPVEIEIGHYRIPAAPKLGGGGVEQAAPASTPKRVAKATPHQTPVFVEPKAIPDTTPIPDDTAIPSDDTTLAQNDGRTGPIGDPNAPIGPGVPTGRADSECLENCDENGLPGFSGPVPSHLLSIAPVPLDQPQPRYPQTAKAAHITGTVIVEIIVGVDGRVQSAKVVKGGAPFEAPTLDAVKRWRYMPVMHQGKPIVWKSNVTIRFQLD